MKHESGTWNPAGRTLPWRVRMVVSGLVAIGFGVVLVVWPRVLWWTVAGVFFVLGAVLILSAVAARAPAGPDDPHGQRDDA